MSISHPTQILSGPRRRALKRREKRLAETGRLDYRSLGSGDDAAPWIEAFLQCEASGWKGQAGTALACDPANRRFFHAAATEAHRRGRLLMLALHRQGRPIACRCSFQAGEGSFAFKTAYDEQFASFSPGVLLEVDNIRRLHRLPAVRWMDSCTSADDGAALTGLWNDARIIQTLLVATGKWSGNLAVSLLPLLRWLKRLLFNRNGERR